MLPGNILPKVVLLSTVLLLYNIAVAQYTVQVTDEKNTAIEDAFVTARHSGSGKEYICFTNNKGMAGLPFSGTCTMQIKKLGYSTYNGVAELQQTITTIQLLRDNVDIKDVVVTGQAAATTAQQSINSIKVIDRKKIDEMGAVNLRDALTNQLNVRLQQDNILGSSASIQGVGGQGIKILIDGVPVIGRMDGNLDLSQINLSNIERIEIIEGPMSVIYGSDALGGVINLISKRRVKEEISGNLNGYYESNGTYNADARFSFKYKSVTFTTSGGRNFFDGYSPAFDPMKRVMQWKPRTQYFNDNTISFSIKQSRHSVFSNFFDEKIINRGAPVVTPYSAYGFDEYYYTWRWGLGTQSDVYLKGNNQLQFINSYSYYRRIKNTMRKDLTTGNSEYTPTIADDDTSVFHLLLFRGTWTNTRLKKFQFQAGYDLNIETAAGQRLEGNLQTIQDYALFSTLQYTPIDKVTLKAGVRGAYNTRYGTPVVPSFNFKYDISKTVSIRASYAQGFRAPSLKELSLLFVDVNHNIQGNSKLKAERSHNAQVEVVYQPTVKDFRFTLRPVFFFNHISNMISLALADPATQLYTYLNIDKFQSTGANVNAAISHKYFDFTAGMSYTGRYNSLSETLNVPHFSWSPEFTSSLSVNIPKINTSAALFYKFNGAIPGYAINENNTVYQTAIQSYSILDASITARIWKERFVISAGAKNLLNVKSIGYNAAGGGAHSSGAQSMNVGMGITGFVALKINIANNFKAAHGTGK